MFIQQWINALQLWFGAWVLFNNPDKFEFKDFLISNFALLFSLFGLGAAFQDIADRKETEKSASRIFFLLDRRSKIDPLSDEGNVLDISAEQLKPQRKKSVKKTKSSKSIHGDVSENEGITDSEDKPNSSKKKSKSTVVADDRSGEVALIEATTDVEDDSKATKKKKKKKSAMGDDAAETLDGESNNDKPKKLKKKKSEKKKKKKTSENDDVDHSETH
jgi:hypothetical protein